MSLRRYGPSSVPLRRSVSPSRSHWRMTASIAVRRALRAGPKVSAALLAAATAPADSTAEQRSSFTEWSAARLTR